MKLQTRGYPLTVTRFYGFPVIFLLFTRFNIYTINMNWLFWKKKSEKEEEEEAKPKSKMREWGDAILFAVIAATLIRWLIMEAYTIPTPSMEHSLLVGDFLFVSKFHYGSRTTTTPLQIPLTHQKIWFTNIPSYSTLIQLPQYRLPGISHVKRNDVVVFNVPPIELNDGIDYPVDLKTNYIKRCVAISGDTLQIIDRQVYVNGNAIENPPLMQFSYIVTANDEINERILKRYKIYDAELIGRTGNSVVYQMHITKEIADDLRAMNFISDVRIGTYNGADGVGPRTEKMVESNIFPDSKVFPWNGDYYGPLVIPREGWTIPLDEKMVAAYGSTIADYEHNDNVVIENGKLFIDGKEMSEYTFNQNYYFMMGDNRHNSLDSRYWGFVPEDHIVG
ncbi:MAG TPA: signal peptidase I, partial [Cyclobacteriaceae bacterium]|nr:signal peptidase I [Cyclobacteriaceae bacterium]